jgi:hypothetical protein
MRFVCLLALAALPLAAAAQQKAESVELVGQLGSRSVLLVLHATERSDGGWRVAGEYVVLATLARRFLEGERSPQLGVTILKEGTSAILFGHPATAELRGTWHDGVFKGTRFAPGGQERERFEFSEDLPSMAAYSAVVRCEAASGAYQSSLAYVVEAGRLKPGSFEWRSQVGPSGHACSLAGLEQQAEKNGLRFTAGKCSVTLRDLGDYIKVAAENCTERCGSEAYLEPLLVGRRGQCRVLHPEPRQ